MTPISAPVPTSSSLLTRVAVGISIAVHVAAVLLSLGYAGAGLFDANEEEAVAVSLVTPEEIPAPEPPKPVEQTQTPEPDLSQLDLRLSPVENPNKQPQKAEPPSPTAKPAAPSDKPQQAATAAPQPAKAAPYSQQPAQPAYTQPQPDISMKYQVDLGLKTLAAAPPSTASAQDGSSDFDAPAMSKADISGNSIAAFRAKLKQCAALPAQISPDDKVVIVLRATFTPDAKLAAAPVLIEASASAKGPALMQAAMDALQSCQPHNALPAESYAEWRVLDLRFTPQDFKRG